MNQIRKFVALTTLSAVFSTGAIFAQDDHRDDHHDNGNAARNDDHHDDRRDSGNGARYDDHHDNRQYVHHSEWRRGAPMRHEDWDRGDRVDYRTYHLSRPRRGYEWRQVDGNFVMAAVATGVIASIVAASVSR